MITFQHFRYYRPPLSHLQRRRARFAAANEDCGKRSPNDVGDEDLMEQFQEKVLSRKERLFYVRAALLDCTARFSVSPRWQALPLLSRYYLSEERMSISQSNN